VISAKVNKSIHKIIALSGAITFFIFQCINPNTANAQEIPDTVGVIEKIILKRDTLIRNPYLENRFKKWGLMVNESTDSTKGKPGSKKLSGEFYDMLFKDQYYKNPVENTNEDILTVLYPYEGKTIRNIYLRKD
jgi:hypothetical protein